MNVTPTAGLAAAWSAAKPSPAAQAARTAVQDPKQAGTAAETPPEERKGPPAPEGQGMRVDKRV